MNLEEFKKAMETDATIENEQLKMELSEQKKAYERELEYLRSKNSALADDCRGLSNRCYVLTKGMMCVYCVLDGYACEHALSYKEKLAIARDMMADYKKESDNE